MIDFSFMKKSLIALAIIVTLLPLLILFYSFIQSIYVIPSFAAPWFWLLIIIILFKIIVGWVNG